MAPDAQVLLELLGKYGYLILFAVGLAEALPLLGYLVPGQWIVLAAGWAAALGVLDIRILLPIIILGGVLGDAMGFWLGRRYGRGFLEKYGARLRIGPEALAKSDAIFAKHGPWALVIVRFSFLARGIGPFLAGVSRMPQGTFLLYTVIGATLWSVSIGLGGYFFGLSFAYLQGLVGRILAYTLVAAVGIWLLYRTLRKYAPAFTRGDFHVALLGVGAGALFGVLADRVERHGSANFLDAQGPRLAQAADWADPILRVAQELTRFEVVAGVSILLLALLAVRRHTWEAALVALGNGGVILLVEALRPIFARTLPTEMTLGVPGGWPSAHGAVPLVFAGVLTYVAAHHVSTHGARIAWGVGTALVALFGALSQVGLGNEHPSAILAGLALGAAWLSVSILVVEFGLKRPKRAARPSST